MKYKFLLIVLFIISFYSVNSQTYVEKRLTNDIYDDFSLCVSGNKMVWYQDSLTFRNLMFWNGAKKIKLVNEKDLKADESYPKISGNYIAWAQSDGHDYEIMLYNGSTIAQITNNDYDDFRPDLNGNRIVWQAYQSGKNNVYYYDGTSIIKMNADTIQGYLPKISNSKIGWYGENDNGSGVFSFENSQSKLISDFSSVSKSEPFVSENLIAWVDLYGEEYGISCYNSSTHHLSKFFPSIQIVDMYNNSILYQVEDESKNDNVYLYTGSSHIQVTTNGLSYASTVQGDTVLYESSGKIYLYNVSSGNTTELTQNGNDEEPKYHGGSIAWLRELNDQTEVFILAPENANSVGDLEYKQIKVYPNPTSDRIFVDGIFGKNYSLLLISLDGKVLKNIKNCNSLDISDLSSGAYVLNLIVDGKRVNKELVVKK